MSRLMIDDRQPREDGASKFMLATTVYESPDVGYTFAIQRTMAHLQAMGVNTSYLLLSGNCHVDDARNSVMGHFLKSDATHLIFIDADVVWQPSDMADLIAAADDANIYGGVYPFRREGVQWPPEMPVRMIRGNDTPGDDGMLEVEGLPTGFMCIPRGLVERMTADARSFVTKAKEIVPILFERSLLGVGRMGGDIGFCDTARKDYGARCFALAELRLGHVGKQVMTGTLANSLRVQRGTVIKYVADRIAAKTWTIEDLRDAADFDNNRWAAQSDSLAFCVAVAQKHGGPILEMGSGLSTVLMAAALPAGQHVYAFENSTEHYHRTINMAAAAGVSDRIALVKAPIINRWYDPSDIDDLPNSFTFAFVDGPPRAVGDRSVFFDALADRCERVICDDAGDFRDAMTAYARKRGWEVLASEDRAMIIGKVQDHGEKVHRRRREAVEGSRQGADGHRVEVSEQHQGLA